MLEFLKNFLIAWKFDVYIIKQTIKTRFKYILRNFKFSITEISKWYIHGAKIVYRKAKRLYNLKIK